MRRHGGVNGGPVLYPENFLLAAALLLLQLFAGIVYVFYNLGYTKTVRQGANRRRRGPVRYVAGI